MIPAASDAIEALAADLQPHVADGVMLPGSEVLMLIACLGNFAATARCHEVHLKVAVETIGKLGHDNKVLRQQLHDALAMLRDIDDPPPPPPPRGGRLQLVRGDAA